MNKCLSSIRRSKSKIKYEVIVVDNSESGISENKLKYPRGIRYIKSPRNVGYGAGNNLGERQAKGEYIFILNPDTELSPKALDNLVSFLDKHKDVAIVAPNLIHETGKVFEDIGTSALTPLRAIFGLSFINKVFSRNRISRGYWLKDIPKNKMREVDVVPGSAFLIRKSIFEKIGGFDENFFLYFEENDLCKRVKDLGYKIYMIPEAEVIHYWKPAEGGEKHKKIFEKSRFYHFKKHFGIFSALFVEAFLRLNKRSAILLSALAVASFLRFYRLSELMAFIGDFGWYYLSARDFLLTGNIPLVGIPSSVPILSQGAIFTWLLAGTLKLFNFNPVSGAYLTSFLGVISTFLTFKLVSEWFGKRVGLIACLITATSPFMVEIDRLPFVVGPIYLLTLFAAWSFTQINKKNSKHFFFLGLWLAILYQFELAGFILLPIIILAFLWNKIQIKRKQILRFILGGLVGLLPFIIYDLQKGVYLQTLGFLGWFATKIFEGFTSIFTGGRNVVPFTPFVSFLQRFIYPNSDNFALAIISFAILFFLNKFKKQKKSVFANKFILLWLFITILGFFIRGVFSEAYMPLTYLPIIVIMSLLFNFLIEKLKRAGFIILTIIIVGNIWFLLNNNFISEKRDYITFKQRLETVDFIIEDTKNENFDLVFRGPGYMFHSADNHYQYLLWWKGNEPVKNSEKSYAIFEYPYSSLKKFEKVFDKGYVKVGVRK